eukprot:TRINITY_DN5703_c0_g2_i25.p1 TRINITY_DN5703_c0_g2~~TRINITY_DN5703_c0_g2_i25.p1  ORF type:complete len:325 (+),score=74.40 TRINITY_DN5703_c0_g2_i25:485-1459(+)
MERMQQVKKVKQFRPPSIGNRTKTANQLGSARKKQNTSNIVLMVQESGNSKLTSKAPISRDREFNQSFSGQFAISPRINRADSELKPDCSGSRPSLGVVSQSLRDSLSFPSRAQSGLRRDNSAYFTLRDQLSKLTMEIHGDCSADNQDESLSSRKQRRTREERRKNGGLYRDASMVLEKPAGLTLKKNMSNLNLAQEFHNNVQHTFSRIHKEVAGIKQRAKSGMKHPIMRNNLKRPLATAIQATKENAKPNAKASASNKGADPRRYLARKYLSELYAKVMFKVKDIERQRKTANLKKAYGNPRQEAQNKRFCNRSRKSLNNAGK